MDECLGFQALHQGQVFYKGNLFYRGKEDSCRGWVASCLDCWVCDLWRTLPVLLAQHGLGWGESGDHDLGYQASG
jgi:hypothetical protein